MTPPYDHAPPGSPPSGEPDSAAAPKNWRSGSQKRRCTKSLQIMLTPEQYAIVESWANDADLSASAYGKALIFGTPGPRAKRKPHVHKQLMADALSDLNRSANVLNQFLPYLHSGRSISLGPECGVALAANRRAAAAILEALGRKEPDDDNQGQSPR